MSFLDSISTAFQSVGDAFTNVSTPQWCIDTAAAFQSAGSTCDQINQQIALAFSDEGMKSLGIQTDGLNDLMDTIENNTSEKAFSDWKKSAKATLENQWSPAIETAFSEKGIESLGG